MIFWNRVRTTITSVMVMHIWCGLVTAAPKMDNFEINKIIAQNASTYKITVLTAASSASVEKKFLSVAIDTNTVINYWDGFNFSSTKMQNVAKALVPCDLRVGGIMADFLQFVPETTNNQPGTHYEQLTEYNITVKQWNELTTFLKAVGWTFIFDFNLLRRKNNTWDPSNAELLLNYSASSGIPFTGFQLGNEPAHYARYYNITVSPSSLSADFKTLKNVISRYPSYKNTSLFGPGSTDNPSSMTYLRAFILAGGADALNEVGIHHYYIDCKLATPQKFMNASMMNNLRKVLDTAFNATRQVPDNLRLRLSETSSCFGGGALGITDSYVDGFLWLDKLGTAAQYGLSRVIRQTFIGGSYQLVAGRTFEPNPDFYLSVLFKRLVEGPVFHVTSTPAVEQLRIYANCARRDFYNYPPGAIVLYYLNLADEDATLSMSQFPDEDSDVFLLTPGDDNGLKSRFVKLNGEILLMSGDTVPQLLPRHQSGDVTITAQSFGFIVIPQANVLSCKNFQANSAE